MTSADVDALTDKFLEVMWNSDDSPPVLFNSLGNLIAGVAVTFHYEDATAMNTLIDQIAEHAKLVASIKVKAMYERQPTP